MSVPAFKTQFHWLKRVRADEGHAPHGYDAIVSLVNSPNQTRQVLIYSCESSGAIEVRECIFCTIPIYDIYIYTDYTLSVK